MSDPRNKTLAKMFGLVRDAEMTGSGVHRMMSYCRDLGLPAPTITESLDPTACRSPSPSNGEAAGSTTWTAQSSG